MHTINRCSCTPTQNRGNITVPIQLGFVILDTRKMLAVANQQLKATSQITLVCLKRYPALIVQHNNSSLKRNV
jgi:hypothetical protein